MRERPHHCIVAPTAVRERVLSHNLRVGLVALFVPLVPLGLACGNDEDVGVSGGSQTTKPPPDVTTTSASDSDSDTTIPTSSATDTTLEPTTTPDPTSDSDNTTTGEPPPPLVVDCGQPPSGALEALYSHMPSADGGVPGYSWSAEGLPAGLTINGQSGLISGTPTAVGDFTFTLTVTDNTGAMAMAECPTIAVKDALTVNLDAIPGPCLGAGESILDYIVGGDDSPIVCSAPKGIGDGTLPDGVTINAETCQIAGGITDQRYGTFAWIVRARQSGRDVFAPYCLTQPAQAASAYDIAGFHSGQPDNELVPLVMHVDPDAALRLDGDADPEFLIDKGECGNTCFFGFAYTVSPSPFGTGPCNDDKDKCFGLCPLVPDINEPDGDKQIGCSLIPKEGQPKTGFAHEMWAKGAPPPAEFQERPFILQWAIDYCVSTVQSDCTGVQAIKANGGNTNLMFPVIVRPG